MSYITREFTGSDTDYTVCVNLYNKAWPEYFRTEKVFRHNDSSFNPKYYFKRMIVEHNEAPVGFIDYMEEWESEDDGDYFSMLSVDPGVDFFPAAEALFETMFADLQNREAIKLNTVFLEDRPETKRFLESKSFTLAQREPRSALTVQNFDFSRFDKVDEKLKLNGIEIASLPELKKRFPDWQRRIYDLEWPILKDVPTPFPIKQGSFEDFLKMFDHPNYMPESDFYALDGDQWVGLSNIKRIDGDAETMSVGITGVLPSHRRKGIATALKLKTIEFAQQYGAKFIRTDNEENNPMYYLNLQLGFKPKPALLNYGIEFEPVKSKKSTSAGLSGLSFFIL